MRTVAALAILTAAILLAEASPSSPPLGALADDPKLLLPDERLPLPNSTTVVIFLSPARPLGKQALSLARAVSKWFQSSPLCGAGVTVVVADCLSHRVFLSRHGLLTLPAVRVFPVGLRTPFPFVIPFAPSTPLENYTRSIELFHTAAIDAHEDLDGVTGPSGALLAQASRVALSAPHESLAVKAREALAHLAESILEGAAHTSRLLRDRAERVDTVARIVRSKLDATASAEDTPDPTFGLAVELAQVTDALLSSGTDTTGNNSPRRRSLLMLSSALRSLLEAKDAAVRSGGTADSPSPLQTLMKSLLEGEQTEEGDGRGGEWKGGPRDAPAEAGSARHAQDMNSSVVNEQGRDEEGAEA